MLLLRVAKLEIMLKRERCSILAAVWARQHKCCMNAAAWMWASMWWHEFCCTNALNQSEWGSVNVAAWNGYRTACTPHEVTRMSFTINEALGIVLDEVFVHALGPLSCLLWSLLTQCWGACSCPCWGPSRFTFRMIQRIQKDNDLTSFM